MTHLNSHPNAASNSHFVNFLIGIANKRDKVSGLGTIIDWLPNALIENLGSSVHVSDYGDASPYAPRGRLIDLDGAVIRIEVYDVRTKTLRLESKTWLSLDEYPGTIIKMTLLTAATGSSLDLYWFDPPLFSRRTQKEESDIIARPYIESIDGNEKSINDWLTVTKLSFR